MTAPKRLVQSSVFVLTAVGFGIPALVLAGSCIWLATLGYPIFLLGAAALLAIGGRGIYLAARGGVLIGCQRIEVRGWFTTKRIPGPSVHSIVVRPDRAGEPVGWLVSIDGKATKLRGATAKHRHSPFSSEPCSSCMADRSNLKRISEELDVPLVEC